MNIGKSIRIAIAMTDSNHQAVAKALGISRTSLSAMTSRNTCLSTSLQKMADLFGMKVSAFIALGED